MNKQWTNLIRQAFMPSHVFAKQQLEIIGARKMLATVFSTDTWNNYWLLSVKSGGTFVKNADATLPSGTVPSSWVVIDDE